nr:hypothetical protein Iba_chr08dCG9990 [Ipomoea batatas]
MFADSQRRWRRRAGRTGEELGFAICSRGQRRTHQPKPIALNPTHCSLLQSAKAVEEFGRRKAIEEAKLERRRKWENRRELREEGNLDSGSGLAAARTRGSGV